MIISLIQLSLTIQYWKGLKMKKLINCEVLARIARRMLFDDPELIENTFRNKLLMNEPIGSCFEAVAWLDKVSNHSKGFNRDGQLQTIRSSNDGSKLHGVFEVNGQWYKSSFNTGRLFFHLWSTNIGCLANVPEDEICILLQRLNAITYTHLKAEFSRVFNNEYNNNAFFSWKNSVFYGCFRHRSINVTEKAAPLVISEFRSPISKNGFFNFIRPYLVNLE